MVKKINFVPYATIPLETLHNVFAFKISSLSKAAQPVYCEKNAIFLVAGGGRIHSCKRQAQRHRAR